MKNLLTILIKKLVHITGYKGIHRLHGLSIRGQLMHTNDKKRFF